MIRYFRVIDNGKSSYPQGSVHFFIDHDPSISRPDLWEEVFVTLKPKPVVHKKRIALFKGKSTGKIHCGTEENYPEKYFNCISEFQDVVFIGHCYSLLLLHTVAEKRHYSLKD